MKIRPNKLVSDSNLYTNLLKRLRWYDMLFGSAMVLLAYYAFLFCFIWPNRKILPLGIVAPSSAYPWPHLDVNVNKMAQLTQRCRVSGVSYGFGCKVPNLDAEPGEAFDRIDCSGFVRWILFQAANHVDVRDGSMIQREWFERTGFKASDVNSCGLTDGAVRIAFLQPQDGGGVGHVALVLDGATFESHGSVVGPDRRVWTGSGWQRKSHVYVLSPPRQRL